HQTAHNPAPHIVSEHAEVHANSLTSNNSQLWRRNVAHCRNVTMSALTEATVIVEASDTSGTLIQARAALQQGRKLFILESCFNRPGLKWPHTYEKRGAIRVRDIEDIRLHLGPAESPSED
ncbi:MAG: DNA-protecting protein DprA, partial [Proteobacteria bacterium]|nr:DNA-protecting protein DprA [Pseudomonadota bacterium]